MIEIGFAGQTIQLMPSGVMFLPECSTLCVSDLHLGKGERYARLSGQLLPPYENTDTLMRLEGEINKSGAKQVICLGDSFDDLNALDGLSESNKLWITRMMAGRRWIWIEGNHDPGPVSLGGAHLEYFVQSRIEFRHIATPGDAAQVSGHFHPKARLATGHRRITRACFVVDHRQIIMPAFGTYTGGLSVRDGAILENVSKTATAVLTGKQMVQVPISQCC